MLTLRDIGLGLHLGVLLICCESAMTWLLVLPTPVLTPAPGVPGSGPPSHLCVQMCVCVYKPEANLHSSGAVHLFKLSSYFVFCFWIYLSYFMCIYVCISHEHGP